ncbi:hypothetical protein CRENBAI_019696 [Crenichthys baileyi]|uniref:Uncharacterized protein n=1 Tax=Crenichthys baileyi TaxID=28760 RepID=A0AAV9QWU4_9TELE
MEFKPKLNTEDSPARLVQTLLTGCSNQRQVRSPPRPIISQGITFKDYLQDTALLLSFDDQLQHVQLVSGDSLRACGKRLKKPSYPPTKRRRGRPAFTPAPATASPGPASAVVLLRSRLSNRSSRCPTSLGAGSDVFFYSGHPTIFPASFISSMDSLQSFMSSFTQLLREFASISVTSAFPLLAPPKFNPLLGSSH